MTKSQRRRANRLNRILKDKVLHWYTRRAALSIEARTMRAKANSWRGFNVGSSGVGVLPTGEIRHYAGYNVKAAEGPRLHSDHCAEPFLIEQAEADGCVEIFGITTEAPYQPDDFSGLDLGVTTMCVYCRRFLRKKLLDPKSAVKKDTLLFFVNGDDPTRHVQFSVEQLLRLYDDA